MSIYTEFSEHPIRFAFALIVFGVIIALAVIGLYSVAFDSFFCGR
ncbi:hypothetical protein UFOVP119_11 [uncultured Caudovirales phage]|uniref:Uncharacterized protein n=1 Tax=uncultured Caudovirales phage TaxID=2100421 RepID=A0A6J5LBD2_9CAUD|nr:hypothetical protein UFOVP119_11 [uncultured Caudovirales phage]